MFFLISNLYTAYENFDHILDLLNLIFFYQTNGAFPLFSLMFMG